MSDPGRPTVLILGGTTEARALAEAADARWGERVDLLTSLAGRTRQPAALPGRVRTGGFGGAAGLARFLESEGIAWLVDATHPFARTMPANAAAAAARAGVPRLRLERPPWRPGPGDRWIPVADMAEAARRLPGLAGRALVTVGAQEAAAFADLDGVEVTVRLIERAGLPAERPGFRVISDRGPFTEAGERALLAETGAEALVTKNSGGAATAAKLAAARAADLPVLMVERPPPVVGPRVETAAAGLAWLADRLAARD